VIDRTSTLDNDDNRIGNLEQVVTKAGDLGLSIPQPFLRFMRDTRLQSKVPSCTACFLEFSEDWIPCPEVEGHFLLRFLNDSQSCLMWYLCLHREREAGIIASHYFFEPDIFDAMEYEEIGREDVVRGAFLCADTFTESLYRFWIENSIWYSIREGLVFTPLQKVYKNQITMKL
jgi:hypothetical protein